MDAIVITFQLFDDGRGQALFAGGGFFHAGGGFSQGIARWDGHSWESVGGGTVGNGTVFGSAVFDGGEGPELYIGGDLMIATDPSILHIARWNGVRWRDVGGGTSGTVRPAMHVYDDGRGPALIVGGNFTHAGGLLVNRIARWDGQSWSALDGGVGGAGFGSVRALVEFDDGRGRALFVAGEFNSASSGLQVRNIATWNGQTWAAVGSGTNDLIRGLGVHDDGSGARLFAGGDFTEAGGQTARYVAAWDGHTWSEVGGGANSTVRWFANFDDGSGPALYACGVFTEMGGQPVQHIGRWRNQQWEPVAGGTNGDGQVLYVANDGSGQALWIGGVFSSAGGAAVGNLARWRTVCDGDVNCDGRVDFGDIEPFVLALVDPVGYAEAFPLCDRSRADANGDGTVDFGDIEAFVALLVG